MERQKVIDRLRKIARIGKGNDKEAASARHMAATLMKKWDITPEEIADPVNQSYRGPRWETWLARGIGIIRTVGTAECKVVIDPKNGQYHFENGEHMLAGEDYKWFRHRIAMLLKNRNQTQSWMEDFAKGLVAGVLRSCKKHVGIRVDRSFDPISMLNNVVKLATDVVQNLPKSMNAFDEGLTLGRQIELPPWIERDDHDTLLSDLFGD